MELRFSFPALDEWLHLSGVKVNLNLGNEGKVLGVKVDYIPPEKRRLKLSNNMELEFNFNSTIPSGFGTSETKITQKAFVSVRSKVPLPLDEFLEVTSYIRDFFSFCTDTNIVFDVVEGYSDAVNGEDRNIRRSSPVKVYYRSAPQLLRNRKIGRHAMLVNFYSLGERFEEALDLWISAYSECAPVLDSYFSSVSGSYSRLEGRYLALVQGIETLHRRKTQEPIMADEEYKRTVKEMLKCVPFSMKEHFRNRLTYGNEPTFLSRIRDIFSPNIQFFGFDSFQKQYYRLIVDTRNFLTHFDQKLERRTATGLELYRLCQNFEVLYAFIFLRNLGFLDSDIRLILNDSTKLRHKIITPDRFNAKLVEPPNAEKN